MMKINKNRLKKCCTPTQIGNAAVRGAVDEATVPGCSAMNRWTDPTLRKPFAVAIATISSANPMGSSHSRLNHRERPMRTRGEMPWATGTEPAHVLGSTMSSPEES
jgi:hypothetical protein